jgi:HK97 family phage major capsid protein
VTQDQLAAQIEERQNRLDEIQAETEGARFDDNQRDEWQRINQEIDDLNDHLAELKVRDERLNELASRAENVEKTEVPYVRRPQKDIYDLSTVARSFDNPHVEERDLHSRAMHAVESARFPHPELDREEGQAHLEQLLGDGEGGDRKGADVARHILLTGSPGYRAAFTKYLSGEPRTNEDQAYLYRAMSLTGASGGVAVPFVLDPTLLPSYNGAVNPYRNIADVRTITVDEWRGVTSGGITAAFQAEAAATTDQSPTLASVSISTEMARVNVPYSIEIGMDWASFASDMASEIQNAKDVLEATKFAVGSGTNEPFGVVTGATTLFTSSDSAALYAQDFYGVHDALPPLYRSRAVWTMNNSVLSRVRQLDTAGGSNMLTPNLQLRSAANVGGPGAPDMTDSRANVDLFGKAVHEASGQAVFADNALVAVIGAFNPYFKIIDRVGLSIVDAGYAQDATTGFPTGQKFMFAYWRVGSKVIHANAFRTLRVA